MFEAHSSEFESLWAWCVEPDPEETVVDRDFPFLWSPGDYEIVPGRGLNLRGRVEAKYLYATAGIGGPYRLRELELVALPVQPRPQGGLRPVSRNELLAAGDLGMASWFDQVNEQWRRFFHWRPSWSELTYPRNLEDLATQRPRTPRVIWEEQREDERFVSAVVVPHAIDELARVAVQGFLVVSGKVIDCRSEAEANYLCALLNSSYVQAMREQTPLAPGDDHDWNIGVLELVPIRRFDAQEQRHLELARLGVAMNRRASQASFDPERPWKHLRPLAPDFETANDLAWQLLQEAATTFSPTQN